MLWLKITGSLAIVLLFLGIWSADKPKIVRFVAPAFVASAVVFLLTLVWSLP